MAKVHAEHRAVFRRKLKELRRERASNRKRHIEDQDDGPRWEFPEWNYPFTEWSYPFPEQPSYFPEG